MEDTILEELTCLLHILSGSLPQNMDWFSVDLETFLLIWNLSALASANNYKTVKTCLLWKTPNEAIMVSLGSVLQLLMKTQVTFEHFSSRKIWDFK